MSRKQINFNTRLCLMINFKLKLNDRKKYFNFLKYHIRYWQTVIFIGILITLDIVINLRWLFYQRQMQFGQRNTTRYSEQKSFTNILIPQVSLPAQGRPQTRENFQHISQSRIGTTTNRVLLRKYHNPTLIGQCLNTLDIFNKLIEENEEQRKKVIRDVGKVLKIEALEPQTVIYQVNSESNEIFIVLQGSVSAYFPTYKPIEQNPQQFLVQYEQIDKFEKGTGFGEAQFISQKKRKVKTVVGEKLTIIGRLHGSSFEEVIENYRLRVYYKKRNMFSKCPLFHNFTQGQLEFIVNNSKPIQYKIGQQIVQEGSQMKLLFLVSSGLVKLTKSKTEQQQPYMEKYFSSGVQLQNISLPKYNNPYSVRKEKRSKVDVGLVYEGEFIGDEQLALKKVYSNSAHCQSQKVQMYTCDYRIIMSQLNHQSFELTSKYYKLKESYHTKRLQSYGLVMSDLKIKKKEHSNDLIKLGKKKIKRRYTEQKPSMIGGQWIKNIEGIIKRKKKMVQGKPRFLTSNILPSIDIFSKKNNKNKTKAERLQIKKYYTECNQQSVSLQIQRHKQKLKREQKISKLLDVKLPKINKRYKGNQISVQGSSLTKRIQLVTNNSTNIDLTQITAIIAKLKIKERQKSL